LTPKPAQTREHPQHRKTQTMHLVFGCTLGAGARGGGGGGRGGGGGTRARKTRIKPSTLNP